MRFRGNFLRMAVLAGVVLFMGRVAAQDLYTMPGGQQSRMSSFENLNGLPGAGGKTNHSAKGNAFEPLEVGETKTLLQSNGAGIVQRIWLTLRDRAPGSLRALRLRMYWDGAAKPAVDVPLGDFFCTALGQPVAFQSALFSNPEGRSFNCYIPMPYKKGAKITLSNEGTSRVDLLFFDIDFISLATPPANILYFHACWHRASAGPLGTDFELLPTVTGKGRFLGVNVGVNVDAAYGQTWWGEGEVKMYIDADTAYPTINGTGAEDYIGTGWGEGTFTQQYQGCYLADTTKRQYAFYRFHIPDAIYFYRQFRATIQQIGGGTDEQVKQLIAKGVRLQPITIANDTGFTRLLDQPQSLNNPKTPKGWVNFYRTDDYAATAYFYLDKPESNLKDLAKLEERVR